MTAASTAPLLELLPLAFISLILPFYGQSRRGVLFGTTVPLDFDKTPEGRAALRRYRLGVLAVIAVVLGSVAAALWLAPPSSAAAALAPVLAIPTELVLTFLLWRREAHAVRPFAVAVPLERHADLTTVTIAAPVIATACSELPLLASALWLHLHWAQIPQRFVQHWNAAGDPDRWGTRSFNGVYGILIAGAMTMALLFASSIFIGRANGPQMSQRRRSLVPMAALAWIVSGMFCILSLRPLLHLSAAAMAMGGFGYLALIIALSLWMLQRGQLAPFAKSSDIYDSTPDSGWHGGVFYYNPSDAAVIVPKRFGWGWTFNFARPTAWIYLGAILLFGLAMKLFVR